MRTLEKMTHDWQAGKGGVVRLLAFHTSLHDLSNALVESWRVCRTSSRFCSTTGATALLNIPGRLQQSGKIHDVSYILESISN
jgi:hypothetical protein